jgi:hypothetical protein
VRFSRLTIAGFQVQENWSATQTAGSVAITGEQSTPPSTQAYVEAVHHNMVGLAGSIVPVLWTDKEHLNGFYRVGDSSSDLFEREGVVIARWGVTLERLGSARDVEVESRVAMIARSTDHPVTPVFWHAPAVGHTSYFTGTANPSGSVSRESVDGAVSVQLGIPTSFAPRWTVPVGDYLGGGARLLLDGIRRLGTHTPAHTSWQVDNGLVRVTGAAAGGFDVACWDSGAWRSAKTYRFLAGGVELNATPELTVIRNEPEEVRVRLSYPQGTGRVTADLGLRRGSRFVTGVMKRHSASTLGVRLVAAEAAEAFTGGIRAAVNDADGNKYVVGSARTFTADTVQGGIEKAAVTALDFFAGHEVGGTGAQANDFAAQLLAQYLASSGERTVIVRR